MGPLFCGYTHLYAFFFALSSLWARWTGLRNSQQSYTSYWHYIRGRHAWCTHFFIIDDLEKTNVMITDCIDFVQEFYDQKNAACTPPQPPNAHLFWSSNIAANRAKNTYHFSWMIDFVEEDRGLQTIQQNFTAKQHGKGSCLQAETFWLLLSFHNLPLYLWWI